MCVFPKKWQVLMCETILIKLIAKQHHEPDDHFMKLH